VPPWQETATERSEPWLISTLFIEAASAEAVIGLAVPVEVAPGVDVEDPHAATPAATTRAGAMVRERT
jgi:hypothetical protein